MSETFVRLEVFDPEGQRIWRTFNLRYVRHFDEASCKMQLNGASKQVQVTRESMPLLVEAALGARPVPVSGVLSVSGGERLADAVLEMARSSVPWWRRVFR